MGQHSGDDHTTPGSPLSRRAVLGAAGLAGAGLLAAPASGTEGGGAGARALPDAHVPTAAEMQALALVSFSTIRTKPVYYGLETSGTRTWRATADFRNRVGTWMDTLEAWSGQAGHGRVSSIGTAGFYVDKPGQHGAGTAMDLSIVRWGGGRTSNMFNGDHASSNRTRRRRYFAVEATLRSHFRYVLDGNYDAAHRNHFHADIGALPNRRLLQGSRSDTVFVQAVCNAFLGSGIAVDGAWGSATQREVDTLKRRLGVVGDLTSDRAVVNQLLRGIALHGFRDQAI